MKLHTRAYYSRVVLGSDSTPEATLDSALFCITYKSKYNIQALFFDYIKVPASQGSSLQQIKEYQALGFFTSTLKDIAGKLKIPVYSAVQENRNDEKGTEKSAGNVAGSDRILQLATKLMFLYAKSEEQIARDSKLLGNRQIKRLGISA